MAYNSNHHRPYNLDYSPNEEFEEFDVRADFDVKGPRWSEVYGESLNSPRIEAVGGIVRSSTIGLGVLGEDKK